MKHKTKPTKFERALADIINRWGEQGCDADIEATYPALHEDAQKLLSIIRENILTRNYKIFN